MEGLPQQRSYGVEDEEQSGPCRKRRRAFETTALFDALDDISGMGLSFPKIAWEGEDNDVGENSMNPQLSRRSSIDSEKAEGSLEFRKVAECKRLSSDLKRIEEFADGKNMARSQKVTCFRSLLECNIVPLPGSHQPEEKKQHP